MKKLFLLAVLAVSNVYGADQEVPRRLPHLTERSEAANLTFRVIPAITPTHSPPADPTRYPMPSVTITPPDSDGPSPTASSSPLEQLTNPAAPHKHRIRSMSNPAAPRPPQTPAPARRRLRAVSQPPLPVLRGAWAAQNRNPQRLMRELRSLPLQPEDPVEEEYQESYVDRTIPNLVAEGNCISLIEILYREALKAQALLDAYRVKEAQEAMRNLTEIMKATISAMLAIPPSRF